MRVLKAKEDEEKTYRETQLKKKYAQGVSVGLLNPLSLYSIPLRPLGKDQNIKRIKYLPEIGDLDSKLQNFRLPEVNREEQENCKNMEILEL